MKMVRMTVIVRACCALSSFATGCASAREKPNELKVRLTGENGMVIEFTAKFKFTRWGVAETEVAWKGGEMDRLAFVHANMLARAFMQTPGFVNIGVGE